MSDAAIHDLTSEGLVSEAKKGFRAKVKQVIGLEGKMAAVRTAASYFGLTESQGHRIYYGNLKGIDALPYVKITRWHDAFLDRQARKTVTKKAIADLKQERFDDAVHQRTATGDFGGVVLRRGGLHERRGDGGGESNHGTLQGSEVRLLLDRHED